MTEAAGGASGISGGASGSSGEASGSPDQASHSPDGASRNPDGSGPTPDRAAPPAAEPVVIAVYYPTAEGFDRPPTAADLQDPGPGPSLWPRVRSGIAIGGSAGLAAGGLVGGLNEVFGDGPNGVLLAIAAVGVVALTIALLLRSRGVLARPGSTGPTALAVTLLGFGAILLLARQTSGWLVVVLGLVAAVFAFRYRTAEQTAAAQRQAWLTGWPCLVANPTYAVGRVSELTLTNPRDKHFAIAGSVTYADAAGTEHVVAIPGGVVPRSGGVEPPALHSKVVVWYSPDHSVVLLRFSAALGS